MLKKAYSFATIAILATSANAQDSEQGLIALLEGALERLEKYEERIRTLEKTATDIPEGAVVAFDRPDGCPKDKGWVPYEDAAGKFILGAGSGTLRYRGPHRPEGVSASVALQPVVRGDQGGAETHTLTADELPRHRHNTVYAGEGTAGPSAGNTVGSLGDSGSGEPRNYALEAKHDVEADAGRSSYAGKSDPHNNMPPFIALYFCKKEAG